MAGKVQAEVTDAFEKKVREAVNRKIKTAIDKTRAEARKIAKDLMSRHLLESSVFQYVYRGSLQAEFGLTDENAIDAGLALEKIIDEITSVIALKYTIFITGLDIKTFENFIYPELGNYPWTYDNDGPAEGQIEWMKWLLRPTQAMLYSTRRDIKNYGILYSGLTEKARSRSGRAVMVNKKHPDVVPYSLPAELVPSEGINIIDQGLQNQNVRDVIEFAIAQKVMNKIR